MDAFERARRWVFDRSDEEADIGLALAAVATIAAFALAQAFSVGVPTSVSLVGEFGLMGASGSSVPVTGVSAAVLVGVLGLAVMTALHFETLHRESVRKERRDSLFPRD
jgi:hypothetical protein